jgi:membrane protease subunit (stomatin/prohibitin family)
MSNDHLPSVISHEFSSNDVLVFRSEIKDFTTKSQLIVHQTQEALFVKEGEALDLFGAGRHSLSTDNVPLLKKLIQKIFKNEKTPFSCDVYFFNMVNVLDLLWGTDSPIMCEDGKYHIIVGVRANGQMGVKIEDSRKFFAKIVGQMPVFDVATLKKTIKGMLMSNVKDEIAKVMVTEKISFLDVATKMREISKIVSERLNKDCLEFGISVVNFLVGDISVFPDDYALLKAKKEELAGKYQELDYEAEREVRIAEAKAKARSVQGYSYQEERKYDVLEGAAKNEGSSSSTVMGAGIGLGMGLGIGEAVKDASGNMSKETVKEDKTKKCAKCSASAPMNAKFCLECGEKFPSQRFCLNCGSKLVEGAKFCPECGTKVE